MANEECVPSGPVRHGSVSGLPARAMGNNKTTSDILVGVPWRKAMPRILRMRLADLEKVLLSTALKCYRLAMLAAIATLILHLILEILLLTEERMMKKSWSHCDGYRHSG